MKTFTKLLFAAIVMAISVIPGSRAAAQGVKTSRYIVVAASNTCDADKKIADVVCTGKNDEATINKVITGLKYGGTIQFLDGDYYIDAFDQPENTAIYFGYNDGNARTITLIGSTENKSYNTHFGTVFHVTEKAFSKMDDKTSYRVFYGCRERPESEGAFFKFTFLNNVNFENFYLFMHNAQKKVIGFDGRHFGNSYMRQVGVYTEEYFNDRFLKRKPATPVEGCIGVVSPHGANDEMSRLGYDCVNTGGLHTGFCLTGVEHLIMKQCTAARCVIGYLFDGREGKTLTMINCCDEGNAHLPIFKSTGTLTCIDFNIERLNAGTMPDDPAGPGRPCAYEAEPGSWHGFISYTRGGGALGVKNFWEEGSGINFVTVDLKTEAATWFGGLGAAAGTAAAAPSADAPAASKPAAPKPAAPAAPAVQGPETESSITLSGKEKWTALSVWEPAETKECEMLSETASEYTATDGSKATITYSSKYKKPIKLKAKNVYLPSACKGDFAVFAVPVKNYAAGTPLKLTFESCYSNFPEIQQSFAISWSADGKKYSDPMTISVPMSKSRKAFVGSIPSDIKSGKVYVKLEYLSNGSAMKSLFLGNVKFETAE